MGLSREQDELVPKRQQGKYVEKSSRGKVKLTGEIFLTIEISRASESICLCRRCPEPVGNGDSDYISPVAVLRSSSGYTTLSLTQS